MLTTERFGTNGKATTVKASKVKSKASKPQRDARVRHGITVGMGCGIPCLSFALSNIGGRLIAEGHMALGSSAMALCCVVLTVSLSHLAWSVRDITRSAVWQSWCLAVAIDLSLVLGELASVSGFDSWLTSAVMVSVCVVSAVLNCWAFLRHGTK